MQDDARHNRTNNTQRQHQHQTQTAQNHGKTRSIRANISNRNNSANTNQQALEANIELQGK
eukprot:6749973-Lingulodinium_polyedra.AAC.1